MDMPGPVARIRATPGNRCSCSAMNSKGGAEPTGGVADRLLRTLLGTLLRRLLRTHAEENHNLVYAWGS